MASKLMRAVLLCALILPCTTTFATTFVVPTDAELVEKSPAIVRGVVVAADVLESESGHFETVYQVRVLRTLKGDVGAGQLVAVKSPGGTDGSRFTIVESSAHFAVGEEYLVFLTPRGDAWTPTDMVLGKFRPALTSAGYSVLVRDEDDIVGWSRDGKIHREPIRLEEEFVRFIEDRVADRPSKAAYTVEAQEVLPYPQPRSGRYVPESNALFAAPTYSIQFVGCDNSRYGGRRTTVDMDAGITYVKNDAQTLSGAADGGVSTIENGLNAWNSDCESAVKITYGGTAANLVDGDDGINAVVFNDPVGDLVPGNWTGSGTIAIAFSSGNATHTFDSADFVSLSDTDIVFQNGYTASEASLATAMTHEIGHTIGLRHSNQHFNKNCSVEAGCVLACGSTPACDPAVSECTSTAIMNSSVNSSLNFTLQTWDQHAVNALYPAVCEPTLAAPTNVQAIASSATAVFVSWSGSDGATSYTVWRSQDGVYTNLGAPAPPAATSFLDETASPNSGYFYQVEAHNASGSSPLSGADVATTLVYTDPTLSAGMTLKAVHLTELRTAANLMRQLTGSVVVPTYTDPTITPGSTVIKAVHFQEVETVLRDARTSLGMSVPPLLGITDGGSIPASHVSTLRTYAQ